MQSRNQWLVGVALGALLVFWFVWPTPYEYTRKAPDIWRTNRFSGVREKSTEQGWLTDSGIKAIEERSKEATEQGAFKEFEALRVSAVPGELGILRVTSGSEWSFEIGSAQIEYFEPGQGGKRISTRDVSIVEFTAPRGESIIEFSENESVPVQRDPQKLIQTVTLFGRSALLEKESFSFKEKPKVMFTRELDLTAPEP